MASGTLDVKKRRGDRKLRFRRQKRSDKCSVRKQCGSGKGDDDFAHLFRASEEWNGVSRGKDDNLVDEGEEIGMNQIGCGFSRPDSYLVVNLSTLKSKRGVRKLKRRLTEELEQVRDVVKQIKDQRTPTPPHSYSSMGGDDRMRNVYVVACRDENTLEEYPDVAQFQDQDEFFASVSGRCGHKTTNKSKEAPMVEKESNVVVSKNNTPISRTVGNPSARVSQSDYLLLAFKSCKSLLMQLMKHKCGWVFNEPVDADRFNLYDYHSIIKQPMDLGTIKERLTTNWYESPMEFAEDVRLTFHNAMAYNPKGHEVYLMAEQLSEMFEKKWIVIEDKYKFVMVGNIGSNVDVAAFGNNVDLVTLGRDVNLLAPTLDSMSHPSGALESSCSETHVDTASPGQGVAQQMPEVQLNTPSMGMVDGLESSPEETPVDCASPFQDVTPEMPDIHGTTPSTRTANALEVNSSEMSQEVVPAMVEARKDMSYEEKKKLNASIQELPQIKLDGVVVIIKKENSALFQNDDEVELDINFLDAETLLELEKYVLECNGCS